MCRLLVIGALLCGVAAGAQEPGVAATFLGDVVVVPLVINGVGPYPFLVDLASPGVVIDSDVAHFVKLPRVQGVRATRQSTSGRQISATAVEVTTLEAGRAVARNLTATVTDLRTFKRRLGTPVAGIVSGREFGANIRLDLGKGIVDFSKPETGLSATDTGIVALELTEAGAPAVKATLDGQHVLPVALDTMCAATLAAPEPMLRELAVVTQSTRRLEADAPPTGQLHPGQAQVRLKSLRVGACEVDDPVCALTVGEKTARVGIGFLRRFVVTLDYETKLARFEAVAAGEPIRDAAVTGYGLGLWRFNGLYWSVWVAQKSPAARAGLVSGGILTAVDGKDLKGMACDGVRELLQPHGGAKVKVSVQQGDDTKTVELVAEELL